MKTGLTRKVLVGFLVTGVALSLALSACSGSKPTTPATSKAPTTTAPAATTAKPATTAPATTAPATTAAAKPYYQGKTITMLVGAAAGGGTDSCGRLIAQFLTKHVPGNPPVVCRNMGVGYQAINYLKGIAPKDGTYMVAGGGSLMAAMFLQPSGMEVKGEETIPLSATKGGTVAVIKPGMLTNPWDLPKVGPNLVYGYAAPTEGTAFIDCLAMNVLNYRPKKCVWGYQAGAEVHLAILRGELDYSSGSPSWFQTAVKPFIDTKDLIPMYESGIPTANGMTEPSPYFTKDNLMTVQQIYEKIYGKPPSGRAWEMYVVGLGAQKTLEKVTVVSNQIPPAALDALRQGVASMMKDPEFMKLSDKITGGQSWFFGTDLEKMYKNVMAPDPSITKDIKDYMTKEFGAKF